MLQPAGPIYVVSPMPVQKTNYYRTPPTDLGNCAGQRDFEHELSRDVFTLDRLHGFFDQMKKKAIEADHQNQKQLKFSQSVHGTFERQ